jgi:hypothetical protein
MDVIVVRPDDHGQGVGFVLHSPTSNAPSLINSDQVPELIDEQKVGSSIDSHDIICVYR